MRLQIEGNREECSESIVQNDGTLHTLWKLTYCGALAQFHDVVVIVVGTFVMIKFNFYCRIYGGCKAEQTRGIAVSLLPKTTTHWVILPGSVTWSSSEIFVFVVQFWSSIASWQLLRLRYVEIDTISLPKVFQNISKLPWLYLDTHSNFLPVPFVQARLATITVCSRQY